MELNESKLNKEFFDGLNEMGRTLIERYGFFQRHMLIEKLKSGECVRHYGEEAYKLFLSLL